MTSDRAILVINCGSSSVKFALFADEEPPTRLWAGAIERIGLAGGRFRAIDESGNTVIDQTRNAAGALSISADLGPVTVEAFPTDEELMIARHVQRVLVQQPAARRA